MIRPFDLPDLFSVYQSSSRILAFDTRQSSIQPLQPFRRALLGRIFPRLFPETYLAFSGGTFHGFAQISHRLGNPRAHLRLVAPDTFFASGCALSMVEMLLTVSGARRAHYLVADAETHSDAYGFLRRSGFSVFARQTIWQRDTSSPFSTVLPAGSFRPVVPTDQPAIAALFYAVVPAMAQQIESPPETKKGWVLLEDGELVGFFQFSSGALGTWVDPFFHPSAQHAGEWLSCLAFDLLNTIHGPLYICVRSYQEWMGSILRELGFVCSGNQSVLARRIVAPAIATQPLQLTVAEGGAPQVTTLTPPSASPHRGV
jgi:hypothetical protein